MVNAGLLELLSIGSGQHDDGRITGVVIGIVTNNNDPDRLGRVKVRFPWLSGSTESHWARVATPMAGNGRGLYFLPEVDDEVLVLFERGDVRFPFVIGALVERQGPGTGRQQRWQERAACHQVAQWTPDPLRRQRGCTEDRDHRCDGHEPHRDRHQQPTPSPSQPTRTSCSRRHRATSASKPSRWLIDGVQARRHQGRHHERSKVQGSLVLKGEHHRPQLICDEQHHSNVSSETLENTIMGTPAAKSR